MYICITWLSVMIKWRILNVKKNQQSFPELGCTIHLSTIWTTYNLLTIRQGKNGRTFLGYHKRPYYKMKSGKRWGHSISTLHLCMYAYVCKPSQTWTQHRYIDFFFELLRVTDEVVKYYFWLDKTLLNLISLVKNMILSFSIWKQYLTYGVDLKDSLNINKTTNQNARTYVLISKISYNYLQFYS